MSIRVMVWGSGNVGRPAVRAVLAHADLELAALVVSSPDKVGRDAGDIAGVAPVGIVARDDWRALLDSGDIDAVVYTATADTRPVEAFMELLACLEAGLDVVSTAFYPLLYPACGNADAVQAVSAACERGQSSVYVSGIDPGWALDVLPLVASGVVSDIGEIRVQEIFNYALYDQPQVVREVIGFGGPMQDLPPMLQEESLRTVWEPMVRVLAEGLQLPLREVSVSLERLPLEQDLQIDGMGEFRAGTQGAFRFEVRGCGDGTDIVVEHITRIHRSCAPQWPYPPAGEGCHQVVISGNPQLVVSVHGHDPVEPGPAGGGNCVAANRIVNALPAVVAATPGIVHSLQLPPVDGSRQLRALQ